MRVGLFTDALADRPLGDALDWLAEEVPAVRDLEVGVGGYSAGAHLADLADAEARGYRLAALNASGNPLAVAAHDAALREAIRLAGERGIERVVCMSGGDPRLAGAGWFPGLDDETERLWAEEVLPYWREVGPMAERAGVRLCLELEPGSAAFNTSTFERLAACSPAIAVNLDPSHFLWQGIDPVAVCVRLAGRVGWAHGKDTVVDPARVALDGLIDRSAWRYAAVGAGNGVDWWRRLTDALRAAGYDDVIAIEVEDEELPAEEAIRRSAELLEASLGAEVR